VLGSQVEAAATVVEPARVPLADELGLSEDELAMTVAADANAGQEAAPTIIDHRSEVDRAAANDPHSLAERIAAQLDASPDGEAEGTTAPTDDADANVRRRRPPAPVPHTAVPSAIVAAGDETLPAMDAVDGTDRIHTRRTQIDIEPLPTIDRFGISPGVAAGLFVAAFLVVFVIVKIVSGGGDHGDQAVDDAGVHVATTPPPPPVEPPAPPPSEPPPPAEPPAPPPVEPPGLGVPPPPVAPPPVAPPPPPSEPPPVAPAAPPAPPPVAPPAAPPTPADEYAKHLRTAEALAKRGDYGKSVRAYKAALAVDKDAVAAHLGLGNAYYELDSLDAAIFHLERARSLAPRDAAVYVHLGAAYQSASRTPDAITAYQRYLELAPNGPFARDVRGIVKGLTR